MKSVIALLVVLAAATPCFAQLAPWWIPDEGCLLGFIDQSQMEFTESGRSPLILYRTPYFAAWEGYFQAEHVLDAEGDLCVVREEWLDYATDYSPQWLDYQTPLKVLDYPLTTGKTWTSVSARRFNSSGIFRSFSLEATVVGPAVAQTGLGALDVLVVRYVYTSSLGTTNVTRLLHDQLGDVTGLVSFTGCETVPEEAASFGRLKATYR